MEDVMITTVDNPYNPFTEWEDWLNYDVQHGYMTCERLASITTISDSLSEEENNQTINESIDQLIRTGAISKDGKLIEFKKVKRLGK